MANEACRVAAPALSCLASVEIWKMALLQVEVCLMRVKETMQVSETKKAVSGK